MYSCGRNTTSPRVPRAIASRICSCHGFDICCTTSFLASSAVSPFGCLSVTGPRGPSRMTSSCTCISSFQPSRLSSGHLAIATIAAAATSAAEPWMGVLMAARSAWPLRRRSLLAKSGSGRLRPSSVDTNGTLLDTASLRAHSLVSSCHVRTSDRSAYHFATVSSASASVVLKSLARPCAVLPYAMLKLRILALRRSLANLSLSSGLSGAPEPSHSR
mmetsp:Transcript_37145/g.109566  ORF Transcript_37145/g.109566 Transcript_37145/m.109566 type:complete len:217 (-) Transcript_37145:561-1211(-)